MDQQQGFAELAAVLADVDAENQIGESDGEDDERDSRRTSFFDRFLWSGLDPRTTDPQSRSNLETALIAFLISVRRTPRTPE